MSQHTLAILILGLLFVNEGYALAVNEEWVWNKKKIYTVPMTIFVWWLVISIIF